MDLATFLIQCLNALQYGLLLFLVASGLTLIFGIMGVINLAHGSFYMIGAYLAFVLAPYFGDWFVTQLVVGVLLAAAFGYLLEWAFFSFLYQREHLQQVLIICFVVVVIGGIVSITGALIASLLVGVVDTFGKVFFAEYSGVGVYLLMAVILVWRPEGLMKRAY